MKASPHQSGFTIIELLVTIGILSLLVGLVVPAASSALTRAKESKKLSNMRNIYAACMFWSAENENRVVPVFDRNAVDPTDGATGTSWKRLILPYLKIEDGSYLSEENTVFKDPFFKTFDPKSPTQNGYGMNQWPLLPESTTRTALFENMSKSDAIPEVKLSTITFHDRRLYFGDCNTYAMNSRQENSENSPATDRHDKGTRGMFCLYSGRIVKWTAEEARLSANDPAALEVE